MMKAINNKPRERANHYQPKQPNTIVDTLLLDAGNLFLFLSGFFMLYTAYRDRKILKGYNLPGTLLIVLAIGLALAYYAQQAYWLSFALTLPNYTYWLVVCTSIFRRRLSHNRSLTNTEPNHNL